MLSPVFTTENTQYVIWLPYETDSVTISGSAEDSKASVTVDGGSGLVAGADNEIKVICAAEDGTQKVYTVIAKRAAAHDGSVDPTEPPTEPTQSETEPSTVPETEPTGDATANTTHANNASGIAWWWLIIVGVVTLGIGFAGGLWGNEIIKRKA